MEEEITLVQNDSIMEDSALSPLEKRLQAIPKNITPVMGYRFVISGDLNGDGTVDISYVVQWADWSSLNTWHVMSYKNKMWTELYSFPIWDWQLPDLPETNNRFGLFGLEQHTINTTNDSINQILEHQLNSFEGLLKKVAKNKIQIIYRRKDADMDSTSIDLRNPKELE